LGTHLSVGFRVSLGVGLGLMALARRTLAGASPELGFRARGVGLGAWAGAARSRASRGAIGGPREGPGPRRRRACGSRSHCARRSLAPGRERGRG
jgi:hypothetical protein